MTEKQIKTQPRLGSRDINISDRANEPKSDGSPSGSSSWYFAQPAAIGVKYSLTVGGYAILA